MSSKVWEVHFSTDEPIYNMRVKHNQRRFEKKFYDELKAEMVALKHQMVEAKKNEMLTLWSSKAPHY